MTHFSTTPAPTDSAATAASAYAEGNGAASCACDQAAASATVAPVYRILATDDAWQLTVQLPGVNKAGLSVTDEDGVLTVRGERAWKQPEGWSTLHRESDDAAYELSLRHDDAIDVEKIRAELADGILRVTLPRAEAGKPRKIAVN